MLRLLNDHVFKIHCNLFIKQSIYRQIVFAARENCYNKQIGDSEMLFKWVLCLNIIKPPFLHDKLCWRSYFDLQLHISGKRDNGHPYRRSKNSCFNELHPSSFSGRVNIHVDAPFTWLIFFKRMLLVGKSIIKLWSLSVLSCNFSFLILYFNFSNWSLMMLYLLVCSKCSLPKILWCFLNFGIPFYQYQQKKTIPIPLSFTGNDSSFLSTLLGICPSIRAGIKTFWIYWPSFCKCWQISGIVLMV